MGQYVYGGCGAGVAVGGGELSARGVGESQPLAVGARLVQRSMAGRFQAVQCMAACYCFKLPSLQARPSTRPLVQHHPALLTPAPPAARSAAPRQPAAVRSAAAARAAPAAAPDGRPPIHQRRPLPRQLQLTRQPPAASPECAQQLLQRRQRDDRHRQLLCRLSCRLLGLACLVHPCFCSGYGSGSGISSGRGCRCC